MLSQLNVPRIGQKVKVIRKLYVEHPCPEVPAGAFATVTKNDNGVTIIFDDEQPSTEISKTLKEIAEKMGEDGKGYAFIVNSDYEINNMVVNGLLEFHMCCQYME